jgi:hypothetical protein
MTTQEHLSNLNVTMEQARNFLIENINMPENIFKVAKEFNFSSWELADILGDVNTLQVIQYFNFYGFDTSEIDGDGIISLIDFDDQPIGNYSVQQFKTDLEKKHQYVHLDGAAEIVSINGNNQLQVTSLANEIEKSLQAVKMIEPVNEVFFSYDVTFQYPFDWQLGKIPGIGAITGLGEPIPTGGKSAAEAPGNSHRLSFKQDGLATLYSYDQDRGEGFGTYIEFSQEGESFFFPTDQVLHVEMYLRMDEHNKNNGVLAAFVNGQANVIIQDGNWREPGIEGFNALFLDFFHGGNQDYAPEYDSVAIFDNFKISHLPENLDLFYGL